jgi:hypothetical protein
MAFGESLRRGSSNLHLLFRRMCYEPSLDEKECIQLEY